MYYLVQQPTSSQLVVKSSAILTWIFAMAMTGVGTYFVLLVWLFLPDPTLAVSIMTTGFGLFFFVGAVQLFHVSTVVTTFYKNDGFFVQERKWLWKNETIQQPIQTVRDIHVSRKGDIGKARKYFKIILELDSEELLPLSSGNHTPEGKVKQQAQIIRTFIELTP